MAKYEYKVVPAPRKGRKAKGYKSNEDRFSLVLQEVMNTQGADGWEYLRAETLPSDERAGLTGSQTVYRDMLVFRRSRTPVQASLNLPAIDHMPEDSPAPPPLTQGHRIASDTDAPDMPDLAPPVHDTAQSREDDDDDDNSDTTVPPRSA